MSKRMWLGGAITALAVALTAGTLMASNMGFKLNMTLNQTQAGTSKTGLNAVALPDNRQSGLNTAKNLMDDVGFAQTSEIRRYNRLTDSYTTYTGRAPQTPTNDFALTSGDGYFVRMRTTTNYIIVGSDDPALAVTLNQTQAGVSKSGLNLYAFNYHQTAGSAKQLMDDVGFAQTSEIRRYNRATDSFTTYTGRAPQTPANDFAVSPGDAYFIRMRTTVNYTPSHY